MSMKILHLKMLECYPINSGKESITLHVFWEFGQELSHQDKICFLQHLILVQAEHTKGSSEQESFSIPKKYFASSYIPFAKSSPDKQVPDATGNVKRRSFAEQSHHLKKRS